MLASEDGSLAKRRTFNPPPKKAAPTPQTNSSTYKDHGKRRSSPVTNRIKRVVSSVINFINNKKNTNKLITGLLAFSFVFGLMVFFAARRHCDIILTGRVGYGTDLTGHFALQEGEYNGHPFYASQHMFLYFSGKFSNWHISETLGADSSLAYAVGIDHPNAYSADELDQWYIWNGDTFRYDPNVESRCVSVSDEGYISLSPEAAYKKCLDISGGDGSNGANVHIWRCHGGHNQDWKWDNDAFETQPMISRDGRCMEAISLTEGSNVRMWDCTARNNQKWEYDYETKEIKTTNGLCLHANGAARDGTNVIIQQCSGSKRQKWKL